MHLALTPMLDALLTGVGLVLFVLGLVGLLIRRNVIRQVIGLKIMLQGVSLLLILAGQRFDDMALAQSMVVSALIVEAVVIAIALALIVNVFHHYPSGDVDDLRRLWG